MGCSEKIVSAHTVQRGGVLDRVAEDGHVLAWQQCENHKHDLRPRGINRASTFPGFCSRHDNDVFRPLDREAFVGTPEQAFLLCLRALAHECHKKTTQITANAHYQQAFASLPVGNFAGAAMIEAFTDGLSMGERDMGSARVRAWLRLAARDYSHVGIVAYRIDAVPEVAACGWTSPEYDFQSRPVQDLGDSSSPVTGTACFILPSGDGGVVGLAWLERTRAAQRLFRSAMRLDLQTAPHDMLRFALTHSEDCYFRPGFWRGMPPEHRDWVRARLAIGTAERPATELDLLDDRVRVVGWRAIERFAVEPRSSGS